MPDAAGHIVVLSGKTHLYNVQWKSLVHLENAPEFSAFSIFCDVMAWFHIFAPLAVRTDRSANPIIADIRIPLK